MTKVLVVTDVAADGFHTHQILVSIFNEVKVCNSVAAAKVLLSSFQPDLIVASDFVEAGPTASEVVFGIGHGETPALLLCGSHLQIVGRPDPARSVRVVPPLNTSNAMKALEALSLNEIVGQSFTTHLNRNTANE